VIENDVRPARDAGAHEAGAGVRFEGAWILIREQPPAGRDDPSVTARVGLFELPPGTPQLVGDVSVRRSRIEWLAITHVQGSMHLDLANRCADGMMHGTLRATLPVSNVAKGYEPPPVRLVVRF
jgi:hypothetical protein